ncbi:putative T7SS-secreted protein [Streptomyces sp. NPDC048172]|uniref:putative T7SS-secreted protein n=1 Tax=Streptomyces sp. NPDC048172 TaxID=3365505 RepID=UPI003723F926
MGWGDLVPDGVKDKFEDAKEAVGDGVEGMGNWGADRLDDAGWQGGADFVRDKSRSMANRLGADVAELQLDESDEPDRLVYGSPGKLRATSEHLTDFQKAFNQVARGLKRLPEGKLKGKAADAFWDKVGLEPAKWTKAADACEKAAGALDDFAGTVEWAQRQAREAVAKYKDDKKDEAEEQLVEARTQRNTAAARAQKAVKAAAEAAPPKPDYGERAKDGLEGLKLDATHVAGGVVKGVAGTYGFVRSVNPVDPYNLTHPAEYATNLASTNMGIVRMANDPVGTGKQMWDGFQKDGAEGVGRLIPELAGTKGAGAALRAAKASRTAARGARVADDVPKPRVDLEKKGPDDAAKKGEETPSGGTDPVDLSTGRMYLPQTDLTLPGTLPFSFVRRVESGYRQGRWFGPSWSSTLDQRLDVDAEGVIYVGEDGRLLSFPHPAPGLPTLPTAGTARMPLDREVDGGYTLTDPDTGWTRHFAPPLSGEDGTAVLEQLTDRNGNSVTFEYDEETGTPSRLVHSGGYEIRLTVEGDRVRTLSLGSREVLRYGYDEAGNLTEVTNSTGVPLRFEYDEERRVIAWTDTNDRRYDYVYDNLDRVIAEGGTAGHMQVRIDYDGTDQTTGHRATTLTSAAGESTRTLFDDRGQMVGEIDPLGHRTKTERDAYNRPLSHTDALGRTTRYAYDQRGDLASIVWPDGTGTSFVRNEMGLPTATTGPDGTVWREEWDAYGNRTTVTDPAGHTTRCTYDSRGHLTTLTDALGATTHVRCDAAGLPVEITDPLGATTAYGRDAFGRPTQIVDPLGARTELEWTPESHLARRTDANGVTERWEWDGEGNCTRHIDAAGGETAYEYGHFDVLESRTGPDGARYTFEHDAHLCLTKVMNPQGLEWSYHYDAVGRLVRETDFDGRTQHYAYDAASQLVSRTTPLGETIAFDRDVFGQLVRKDAAGEVTTYAYDPVGRLTHASGPDGELRYQHDKLGRIRTEMADGRVLTRVFDALGRVTRRVTPTGTVSTYVYDAAGNRTGVTTNGHALDSAHDAAGRETTRQLNGALTLDHVWDQAGRLAALSVNGAGQREVVQRAYSYAPTGNLLGIDDSRDGARRFTLDRTGRVTAVHARDWSESYAYDEAGNQTHANWPSGHASPDARGERAYTGTRIRSAGRVRYEHDEAGRIVLRQKPRLSKKPDTWRYEWDAEDRLLSCTTPDGTLWRYTYDPLGRRTSKRRLDADGDTVLECVEFTWDGAILVEQTTTAIDGRHPVTLTWDHRGLHPVTQAERLTDATSQREMDARFYAIVTDLVGTPTELVDELGEVAWHTRTTLWGTTTWNRDATAHTPLRFPGQYHDPETGLHYNYHRHYDPDTARYATPDPLGLSPSPNPSTYVDNPYAWTDPMGLAPKCGAGDLEESRRRNSRVAHTLDEHVHVTQRRAIELAQEKTARMGRPTPNGVFVDQQTAQQVVDYALANNSERISNWLRGSRQELSLPPGRFGADNSLGWVAHHDRSITDAGNGYRVTLERHKGAPGGYIIKTAYPF